MGEELVNYTVCQEHNLKPSSTARNAIESLGVPRLLTPVEAARALRIGRSMMYRLLAAGSLPCVRVGRLVRVREDDLRTYVDGATTRPNQLPILASASERERDASP